MQMGKSVKHKLYNFITQHGYIRYKIICRKASYWLINDLWFLLRDKINNKTRL